MTGWREKLEALCRLSENYIESEIKDYPETTGFFNAQQETLATLVAEIEAAERVAKAFARGTYLEQNEALAAYRALLAEPKP